MNIFKKTLLNLKNTKSKIRDGMNDLTINKTNIKRTIERIETLIKQKRSENE